MNKYKMNHILFENKKAVFRCRMKGWSMVFCLVLFLPYLVSVFWSGNEFRSDWQQVESDLESRITIRIQGAEGIRALSMEEYLYGCLPAVISADYESECLKAQAILLRTSLISVYKETAESGQVEMEETNNLYLSRKQLQEMWGSAFEENYEKIKQAVSDTKGIYITYDGEPIKACYFQVSAGRTRNGSEVAGMDYPYLQSVECPKDYLSRNYLTQVTIKKSKLFQLLGGNIEITEWEDSGYISGTVLTGEETIWISGDVIRSELDLSSSCFSLEEVKNEITFTVKGTGHGLGMSQFAANEMAKEGKDYNAILAYFFQNITMDKYE